jgi:hypothetical protein
VSVSLSIFFPCEIADLSGYYDIVFQVITLYYFDFFILCIKLITFIE